MRMRLRGVPFLAERNGTKQNRTDEISLVYIVHFFRECTYLFLFFSVFLFFV